MPRSWGPSQDARRRLENLAAGRFKPRGRGGGFRPRDWSVCRLAPAEGLFTVAYRGCLAVTLPGRCKLPKFDRSLPPRGRLDRSSGQLSAPHEASEI